LKDGKNLSRATRKPGRTVGNLAGRPETLQGGENLSRALKFYAGKSFLLAGKPET